MSGSTMGPGSRLEDDVDAAEPAEACPTEGELATAVERGLSAVPDLEAHVVRCSTCRNILANAASAVRPPDGGADRISPAAMRVEPQLPSPGERVGRYVLGELVGAGAMGTVYVAHDPELKRRVAVKLLREPEDAKEEVTERSQRFLREAQAMARLTHPNVVPVYDVGRWNERIFISMAFVDGGTLRDWCAVGRTWEEIVDAFTLAGRGLAAAHAAGLIHRDFKPDNVLVTAAGGVCVTDFGLARSVDDWAAPSDAGAAPPALASESTVTRSGALIGTPAYMSPEQLDSSSTDARSDVFSFSVALWEALFHARPFQGTTIELLRQAIRRGPVEPAATEVPGPVRDALRIGLRENPDDRYPSMDALLAALAEARAPSAQPVDGRGGTPDAGRRPATVWPRGRTALLVAALLSLSAIVGGVSAHRFGRTDVPARPFEQLTFNSHEAPVYGIALSPDGASLAYLERRGVYVQEIASRRVRRLDVSPAFTSLWGSVAWFPDGKRLLVGGRGPDGRADLWHLDIATRAATPMGLGDWVSFGAVSPDGARIAIVEHKGVWEGALEVLTADGKQRTLLYDTHDEELYSPPRWSPDGRCVAFIRGQRTKDAMTFQLDVVDVATRARRTILRDDDLGQETGKVAFQWAGDGRIFVALAPSLFALERPGLFAIDAPDPASDGPIEPASMQPVAGFVGVKIGDISFDASGRRMAFIRDETQTDVVAGTLSARGEHLEDVRRLTLSDANERPSDWSSDSRHVLMVSDAREGYGISTLSIESLDAVPIPGAGGRATWPVAGPAGRGILYWQVPAEASGSAFLDLIWLEDGREKRVYRTPREIFIPGRGRPPPRRWTARCAWNADACFLAHPSDEDGHDDVLLESLDVVRGTAAPSARFPGPWQFGFALSPEGKRLAVASPNRASIDVFGVDGALLQRLSKTGVSFSAAAWMRDGDGVIATSTTYDPMADAIFRLSLDGSSTLLWSTKGELASPISAPDGRHVAFTMIDSRSNVWIGRD